MSAGMNMHEPPDPAMADPVGDGISEQTPKPRLWVRLPDGQKMRGRLLRRWQSRQGQWFYTVSLTLWAHAQVDGRDVAEPADVICHIPATQVEQVPDESYDGVPTRRHPAAIARARKGHKAPARPPQPEGRGPWPPARGDSTDRWRIEQPVSHTAMQVHGARSCTMPSASSPAGPPGLPTSPQPRRRKPYANPGPRRAPYAARPACFSSSPPARADPRATSEAVRDLSAETFDLAQAKGRW
ncbi:hypothetical protein GCM10010315_40320 [Streptomyces luteosporeus]|uniref:Uncharacterized protein n=1 Tax=Streptomyces luteosporeus TaxID=173856 RepID=A0ABP6GAP1_9ACTN